VFNRLILFIIVVFFALPLLVNKALCVKPEHDRRTHTSYCTTRSVHHSVARRLPPGAARRGAVLRRADQSTHGRTDGRTEPIAASLRSRRRVFSRSPVAVAESLSVVLEKRS